MRLGMWKAWTVQLVQKWDQQRALRYCRSPTGHSPWAGEWGPPQSPVAHLGFALGVGSKWDQEQGGSLQSCVPHCGKGKGEMGEEAAKGTCPRDRPAPHICSMGFPLPLRPWVRCGPGTGQLRGGSTFHSLEGLLSFRLNTGDNHIHISPQGLMLTLPFLPLLSQCCPSAGPALGTSPRCLPGHTFRWKMVKADPWADVRILLIGEHHCYFSTFARGVGATAM